MPIAPAPAFDKPLISNGYTLSNAIDRLDRLAPSDPSRPRRELWEQFRNQGYLWLKGLLDRKEVLALRARYFELMRESGIVAESTEAVEGIYSGKPDQTGLTRKLMAEFVRDAAYEAFCLSPRIRQFYEEFWEGPVYLHKRKIIRHTIPHDPNCTGAHYDLTYLRAGTDRFCTSWIPLGDIPVEMGGLVYLEGADAMGRKFEAEFTAKNADLSPEERINAFNKNMGETGWLTKNLPQLAERFNTRWLIADYEAGDMVIHSAYMIHAATTNRNPHGHMRLSTDIRYQRLRDEIDLRWQNHWSFDDML
jgi:ectoine hydroxylase-related dioxygenase (phytanoyl-CoA dioxygenase family)